MHSPEQMKKKAEAREDALHHHKHSAVDGKHADMPMAERMYAGEDMHPGDDFYRRGERANQDRYNAEKAAGMNPKG